MKKQITSHKAKNVGVILSYTHSHVFSSITMGCEQILMERGYGMQLSITQNSFELEGKCLELMPPEKISGLIVEGTKSALPNPISAITRTLSIREFLLYLSIIITMDCRLHAY